MSVKKSAPPTNDPPYSLFTNNRFWLLCSSFLITIVVLISVWSLVPTTKLRIIRIEQTYGLVSIIFLYVALLAAPLTKIFPNIRAKSEYLHLRRAIGVSAFFFALLHSSIAFFGQLGGINGLGFLSPRYDVALLLGTVGLVVLTAMAVTSFDAAIQKMGFPRWKKLHQFIYIAGIAILIHIVLLGTHFAYGSSAIARITLVAVLILLMLESVRVDRWLKKKFALLHRLGVASMIMFYILFLGTGFVIGKNSNFSISSVDSQGGHGGGSEHSADPYVSFNSSPIIDGHTVKIDRQQISFERLIAGGEIIIITSNPIFTDVTTAECFLVNQQTYTYYHGLTKKVGNAIQCLPIGDDDPPPIGAYTLYIRLERTNTAAMTIPFNIKITP